MVYFVYFLEIQDDTSVSTGSTSSYPSSERDGATEPSQSPPPDLEALQAEDRYDANAMLQQPLATSTRHADSCEAEGRKYKHGDKVNINNKPSKGAAT